MFKQVSIVVGVVVAKDGKILIGKRHDPELTKGHGKWELLGGKINFKETPEHALIREIYEESGLKIKVVRLLPKVFVNYWKKQGDDHQTFILAYECKVVGGKLHNPPKDPKVSELKFIPIKDINKYTFLPFDKQIIKLSYAGH
jgi:mutator protein MutT